jgi:autonomous glycyl radical cofactor GrcA
MHNLYANFVKILEICKDFSKNLVNELGNIPRPGVVPRFSDLEVVALSLTAEHLSIDSENNLFDRLKEYKADMPNLISRRQFNDRRKFTAELCEKIRKRIASKMDGAEEYFCIDSKPIEVCRLSRGLRCKMKGTDVTNSPAFGYCATQKIYYFGYKLHAVCGLSGVIHSYDLSPANVHDIHFLKDVKFQFYDCCILGDRANPSYGAEKNGLLASLNSVAKLPYEYALDGISNTQTISPGALGHNDEERAQTLVGVLDGYFNQGSHHLNVNVFGIDKLKDAMEHPEKEEYQNFTIRVSGYAVKFIDLTREQQLDVIARQAHERL